MLHENNYKKLGANWFRKGGVALTALAAVALAAFVFYSMMNSDSSGLIDKIPDTAVYTVIGLVALCGSLVFCYQIITIATNKMILSQDGIEIKKVFKRINIPKADVIRIDIIRERVIGALSQNRTVFKIITNTKTYEVNSHEFWGLKRAIPQWIGKNIDKEEEKNNET